MNRALIIFYAIAIAFHAAILFWVKSPAHKPKIFNETYVDVTLTTTPSPQPEIPKSIVVPPPQKIEMPPPKPEVKPQPAPEPKPIITIPESKSKPVPAPRPAPKPIVVPPQQPELPKEKYVQIVAPKYARRVEAIYPLEAQRRHEQGQVTVMIYINAEGALDKVEILKSSGYPLLDAAAIKAVKESQFNAEFIGAIPVGSRAKQTFTFRLQ